VFPREKTVVVYEPQAHDAVDPQVTDTGKPSTRVEKE
jgi:hypothetical protein